VNPIEISRTGLDVEWRRLEICALNLANMNSTRAADGSMYQPQRLLSGPAPLFRDALAAGAATPERLAGGVTVLGLEPVAAGERRVYEPGHPHADADGFVSYPNVDHAAEMTLMLRASRAYEANLAAIDIAQQMYASAFELGRGR
jgi:flagellar basal-body rod protein FlgC